MTKHKDLGSLRNYDPEPEMSKRFHGAQAVMTVKKPTKRIETVTCEITKKVSKTSIIEEATEVEKNQNLLKCQKCLKRFGSKFGLKNHPCHPKDEIVTNKISETDSFDAMMNQAHSDDLKETKFDLTEDSFNDIMSQADKKEYIMESPKSKVQNWLFSLETESTSKREPPKFTFEKRKIENANPNFQIKQYSNDPFTVENHANTSRANYINSESSMNPTLLQAQQAHERQKFFANFFAKEQEIHLELIKKANKE